METKDNRGRVGSNRKEPIEGTTKSILVYLEFEAQQVLQDEWDAFKTTNAEIITAALKHYAKSRPERVKAQKKKESLQRKLEIQKLKKELSQLKLKEAAIVAILNSTEGV